MASIAKKEEILYVLGQENEPCVLDRHSPVLHLIQQIRDETHRFAVTFHRQRRAARQTKTALLDIPGIRAADLAKASATIWEHCKSAARYSLEELSRIVTQKKCGKIVDHYAKGEGSA